MKRLCISRLPKILVIQLKRFDYDWERSVEIIFCPSFVLLLEHKMLFLNFYACCNECACSSYRETAVKFNDYFEFPRELDMSPYTAAKLAKTEGMETV